MPGERSFTVQPDPDTYSKRDPDGDDDLEASDDDRVVDEEEA